MEGQDAEAPYDRLRNDELKVLVGLIGAPGNKGGPFIRPSKLKSPPSEVQTKFDKPEEFIGSKN
ncbi:hypothetical protein A7975_07765 [Bacillus sp. FJAT-26390]|nr:hypothetical protein A7975_07765 [Bacillus sp. FJAT-26390]